jgi:hypothetical protein
MPAREDTQKPAGRPRSVPILAGLQMLQSLGFLYFGYTQAVSHIWPEGDILESPDRFISAAFEFITSGPGLILLAVLMFVVSVELLRLRKWAWLASMSVQGIGLAAALLAYMRQEPNFPSMFLGVLLVFYLNQQEVQDAFRRKPGEEV